MRSLAGEDDRGLRKPRRWRPECVHRRIKRMDDLDPVLPDIPADLNGASARPRTTRKSAREGSGSVRARFPIRRAAYPPGLGSPTCGSKRLRSRKRAVSASCRSVPPGPSDLPISRTGTRLTINRSRPSWILFSHVTCGGLAGVSKQREQKRRAGSGVRGRPQPPAVRFHDRSGDGEAHPGAVRLRGHERFEDRSGFSAGSPTPVSPTAISSSLSSHLRMTVSSPPVSFISSIAFSIRFMNTCCNWTRSAMTSGSASASVVRIEIEAALASCCSNRAISRITALTSTRSRSSCPSCTAPWCAG